MSNKQISPAELAPGQFITVLSHAPEESESEDNFGNIRVIQKQEKSFIGDVLTVLAVDLPFVAVKEQKYNSKYALDTRKTILMELSPEYVKAFQS